MLPTPPAHVGSPVPGGPLVPLIVPPGVRSAGRAPRWIAIEIVDPGRLPKSPTVLVYLVPDAGVALDPKHALLGSWSDLGADAGGTFTVSGAVDPQAMRALRASSHPHVRIVVNPDGLGRARGPALRAAAARVVDAR
ncbi:MAG: hypothetical protein JWN27_3874 [Candidatus Eremiobacteraeota bacterium]|nr:hypothetical protein [Candidatus Eremiobacteraeota bacterium]